MVHEDRLPLRVNNFQCSVLQGFPTCQTNYWRAPLQDDARCVGGGTTGSEESMHSALDSSLWQAWTIRLSFQGELAGRQVAWVISNFTTVYSLPTDVAWPNCNQASLFSTGLWTFAHPHPQLFSFETSPEVQIEPIPRNGWAHRETFPVDLPSQAVCWSLPTCLFPPQSYCPPCLSFLIKEKPLSVWVIFKMLADAEIWMFSQLQWCLKRKPHFSLVCMYFSLTVLMMGLLHLYSPTLLFSYLTCLLVVFHSHPEGVANPRIKWFLLLHSFELCLNSLQIHVSFFPGKFFLPQVSDYILPRRVPCGMWLD